MSIKHARISLALSLLLFSINILPSLALAGSQPDDTDKPTERMDEMLQSNNDTTLGLLTEAEGDINSNHFDRAIKILHTALSKRDDDLDLHRAYAEALEGKLLQQNITRRDPLL